MFEVGRPGSGEARIRHTAIGLNFIDVYFRTGLYPSPSGLPLTLATRPPAWSRKLGEGVDWLKVGDRVAYNGPIGSYCTERRPAAPTGWSSSRTALATSRRRRSCSRA